MPLGSACLCFSAGWPDLPLQDFSTRRATASAIPVGRHLPLGLHARPREGFLAMLACPSGDRWYSTGSGSWRDCPVSTGP